MQNTDHYKCFERVLEITRSAGAIDELACSVLDEVFDLTACSAAQISTWDAERQSHHTVASKGYSSITRSALNDSRYRNDLVWPFLEKSYGAVFWKDCPFEVGQSNFYSSILKPGGYGEGGTVILRDRQQGYLGMLTVNMTGSQPPPQSARDLLGLIGAALVPLVDPYTMPRRLAALCAPRHAAAVFDVKKGWCDISGEGLPPAELLESLSVAPPLRLPMKSNWQHARRGKSSGPQMGKSISFSIYPIHDGSCQQLLTWRHDDSPHGLTPREMEVLKAVAKGFSNHEIGLSLGISGRTASTHVERILRKLNVQTRAGAASMATQMGLYF
ncbi:MAG: response regulator transcription factor [Acidovorax sp.]|jgi:DNA-binding CsgD family transcriptional regulator|nr:response regulator transcription factor [Acidovorax sp.]